MRALRRCAAAASAAAWQGRDRLLGGANRRRLEGLRGRHQGERCFVIGSGPSIRSQELTALEGEVTFAFNAFFLISDELGFLPTYYLIEDPLPAEDNALAVNALQATTKIFPWDLRYCLRPDERTVYVHFDRYYDDYPSPRFPRFSDDARRVVFWGGTVAYMAIQVAAFMGCDPIILLGIDLTYSVPSSETVIVSQASDPNHFHPDYFGAGKRWHQPRTERMQVSFEAARLQLAAQGRKLLNATHGGALEIVPRVDLASLLVRGR